MKVLNGKTEYEIRHAAAFWLMCQDAYLNGEKIPEGVFLLSAKEPTEVDIKWARKRIAELELEKKKTK